MFILDPCPILFNFCFQTVISGKDGVMDLIYGGYSFLDVHITRISNDILKVTPWLLPDGCLHRFETKFDKFIDVIARWSDISLQRYLYKGF